MTLLPGRPRHRCPSRLAVLLLIGLLAAAACSSTEQRQAQGSKAKAGGADVTGTTGIDGTTDTVVDPVTGETVPAGAAGTKAGAKGGKTGTGGTSGTGGTGGSGGTGGTGGSGGTGGGGKLVTGKGITDTTIELGFWYADATAYNAAATGLGGNAGFQTVDDPKGVQNAVIEYVNTTGGIRGRKIVPVWHELKVDRAVTREGRIQDAQIACATYTEDHKVFAFMGTGQWTEDNIVQCADRTGTVMVDGWSARTGVWVSEQRMAEVSDHYYTLNGLTTQRRERALVEALARQGFFTPGARVGLLIEGNQPSIKQGVDGGLKPALAARGVNVVTEAVYPDVIESPWDTYVLQFQQATVTHVVYSASSGASFPTLMFMRAAENQTWRPRYGIDGTPAVWLQNNAPKEQMRNAMGVTWLTGYFGETYPSVSANDTLCRDIMKKKGYPETIGAPFCNYVFFLKTGLENANAMTPAGLAASMAKIGGGWKATTTFDGATLFSAKRHDAATLVRDFAWSDAANRFDYKSGPYSAP